MARSLALALLLAVCLASHLLTMACARHTPPEPEGFDVVDTSPTNQGPSPAGGHGNHPSAAVPAGGAPGVSTESRARGEFSTSPCNCRGGTPVTDAVRHGAGDGEGPGARP
ncbi:hypothetical protein E2562_025842 [Oryza meyeriana var. granulata]|uniref:Uncharacterized protein n=1 Tax=Oryza meyeriana var. granulata TaxID=110450 RepID=A0A6G1E220_9ORYZ|nr:hypothetical protein E2562_025842 [Oryza meyeriana var. granulata]